MGKFLTSSALVTPVSGDAQLKKPFRLVYKWQKRRSGDLLMLAHPLHVKLLSYKNGGDVTVLNDLKYKSVDGDLVGVVGSSWVLETDPVPVTWHSTRGIKEESYAEIVSALSKDVKELNFFCNNNKFILFLWEACW
ncbi:Endo-1 [Sesbania bispinosa]|nr:Endo-1 [Sesbania bispinosa]